MQRRGRRIAMTPGEIDDFLGVERTCRVATLGGSGPHVTALWFVWDGKSLWLNSLMPSRRWTDLRADSRIAVLVDTGGEYGELRGVELRGRAVAVGEVPRTGAVVGELAEPERLFALKYSGSDRMTHDGRHAWLRVTPDAIVSWDFRKLSAREGGDS
ncbi:pyridoxamine 5'-phosphate oxidase family protein [Streptosporangium sp. NPDC002544]|uniref:pyridoxamine 5'-phosphate oxidase family protein n=1 Tax=Streptosporangium sp. NPDC002544 TaxID=3154538 RepID=UPI00331E7C25